MSTIGHRSKRIERAAERLVAHWKRLGQLDMAWGHKAHWFPACSEKQAKALINAVIDTMKEPK